MFYSVYNNLYFSTYFYYFSLTHIVSLYISNVSACFYVFLSPLFAYTSSYLTIPPSHTSYLCVYIFDSLPLCAPFSPRNSILLSALICSLGWCACERVSLPVQRWRWRWQRQVIVELVDPVARSRSLSDT